MKLIIISLGVVTVFASILITDVLIRLVHKKIHKDIQKKKDSVNNQIQGYQKMSDEVKQIKNQINKIK